ncbi:HAD family hydrolase [Actinosynnema sp. NPDC020468]|uniref:HAD family hydrolase n=1 Tax=Actinosynnema sp. NPDC020468 TaxID=3154488 RepID=UPI0033F057C8
MERPALVASDIDGTLLGPDERVTARTARVIGRVLAAGVPFVLVTGRPPRWLDIVSRDAGVNGYAICANGAVLYDLAEDRVVWEKGLDPVRLMDVAAALDHVLPGSALASERVGDVEPFVAETAYTHPWGNGPDHVEVTRAEVFGHRAVKLLVRHPKMTSAEMTEAAEAVLGDEFAITYSTNSGLIEISAAGVTKATGLADVARRHDVPARRVIAFGDMPNDVEMLRWAGHGVAMENAHPRCRAAADEVTATHGEDGVALVLERWF